VVPLALAFALILSFSSLFGQQRYPRIITGF
jgi:hypothetical protein